MLTSVNPKLPMRDKTKTLDYYLNLLRFSLVRDYEDYLIMERDNLQLHFFSFKELDPKANYGQVYIRTSDIDGLYNDFLSRKVPIHPNGALQEKPWGQREFSVLDPDCNLITFGQSIQL